MRSLFMFMVLFVLACGSETESVEEVGQVQLASSDETDPPVGGSVAGSSDAARLRCAARLVLPGTQAYELGHVTSNDMPVSPFAAAPYVMTPGASQVIPGFAHVANGENWTGDIGSQGTQFDGLGHFGYLPGPFIPSQGLDLSQVRYYGNLTQADVKPTASSPLLKLGMETVAPIVTTALVLDMKEFLGDSMEPGEVVTKAMIQATLPRPILPGDAVFIRTGYGERWYNDPTYYTEGPGLAKDAVDYLGTKGISVVGLDNPFTDVFRACQLAFPTPCGSTNGADPTLPFYSHHAMLTQYGVHQIQNMKLDEIADDDVEIACAMVLPPRLRGAGSAPVRPVAFGRPN